MKKRLLGNRAQSHGGALPREQVTFSFRDHLTGLLVFRSGTPTGRGKVLSGRSQK